MTIFLKLLVLITKEQQRDQPTYLIRDKLIIELLHWENNFSLKSYKN